MNVGNYPAVGEAALGDLLLTTRALDGKTINTTVEALSNAISEATRQSLLALDGLIDPVTTDRVLGINSLGLGTWTIEQMRIGLQTAITFLDEGVPLGDADIDSIDFVGSGVSVTRVGNTLTVSVTGGGGGATEFIQLTDVPGSYTGAELKAVRVNAAGTALEFYTPSGGASLVPWDLSPVIGPAVLVLNPFPPEVPVPNSAVIVGDTATVTKVDESPTGGFVKLSSGIPAGEKIYFAVRTAAPVGPAALDTYQVAVGSGSIFDTPEALFNFPPGGGLGLRSAQLGPPMMVVVDPTYVLGDEFLVYIDMVAGTFGVKTSAADVTEAIVITAGFVAYSILAYNTSPDLGSVSVDLAASDLGSGIAPPVGYVPLFGEVPAGLPAGAVDGDHLEVTVAGDFGGLAYAVGDLAVVLDAGTGTVFPVAKRDGVVPTWRALYEVTVGAAGLFPDLRALMLHLDTDDIQGDVLSVTFTGTVLTANDTILRVPRFHQVEVKAPAPMTSAFQLTLDGSVNQSLRLQGEIEALFFDAANLQMYPLNGSGQTGVHGVNGYRVDKIYGLGVGLGDPYPYLRSGFATGAVINGVGYVGAASVSGYHAASKLELGFTTANTGTTVITGAVGGYINTNRPLALANANIQLGRVENIAVDAIASPLIISASSLGSVQQVECGAAGLQTVFDAQDGALHVTTITGTYTNLVPLGRLVNVYDKTGGQFYDGWTADQWTALTLENAWVDIGAPAQVAQFRKVGDMVGVRFAVVDGTALQMFTLPDGFRPPASIGISVNVHDNTNAPDFGHLRIAADGTATLEHPGSLSGHSVWGTFEFSVSP